MADASTQSTRATHTKASFTPGSMPSSSKKTHAMLGEDLQSILYSPRPRPRPSCNDFDCLHGFSSPDGTLMYSQNLVQEVKALAFLFHDRRTKRRKQAPRQQWPCVTGSLLIPQRKYLKNSVVSLVKKKLCKRKACLPSLGLWLPRVR